MADSPKLNRMLHHAIAGDKAAQAELLRELQDVIFRFCLSQLRNREDAIDATQETALRILKSVRQFQGTSKLQTWALGIALNVCREFRRREARSSTASGLPSDSPSESPNPELDAIRREEQVQVANALEELSDRQREAIVLRYFEQLSVEETASVMQVAKGTIKATVSHAIELLRISLRVKA